MGATLGHTGFPSGRPCKSRKNKGCQEFCETTSGKCPLTGEDEDEPPVDGSETGGDMSKGGDERWGESSVEHITCKHEWSTSKSNE